MTRRTLVATIFLLTCSVLWAALHTPLPVAANDPNSIWLQLEEAYNADDAETVFEIIKRVPEEQRYLVQAMHDELIEYPQRVQPVVQDNVEEAMQDVLASAERVAQRITEEQSRLTNANAVSDEAPAVQSQRGTEQAQTYTVGTNCQYQTLQEAVNQAVANPGSMILVEGKTFTGSAATVNIGSIAENGSDNDYNEDTSNELWIYGGYNNDCTVETATRTTLDATGQGDSVMEFQAGVRGGGTETTIWIEDMRIIGGESDSDQGGGLEIDANFYVMLESVYIGGNGSTYGGGIHLNGFNADNIAKVRLLTGSTVQQNTATEDGGGVYCRWGRVDVFEGATIGYFFLSSFGNEAQGNGGGVYLDECWLFVGDGKVQSNSADLDGGGVYMTNNSRIDLDARGADEIAQIIGNSAGDDGGGIYMAGGSLVQMQEQGELLYNQAGDDGGGLYATDLGTVFNSKASSLTPTYCARVRCHRISHNTSGGQGGGVHVRGGASAELDATYFEYNTGSSGSAIYFFRGSDNNGTIELSNNAIARNTATSNYSVYFGNSSGIEYTVHVEGVTFAHNSNVPATTYYEARAFNDIDLDMDALIVWGGDATENIYITDLGATASVQYSLLPGATQGSGNTNLTGFDPDFIDEANDNWHIFHFSPAEGRVFDGVLDLLIDDHDIDYDTRPFQMTNNNQYDAGFDEVTGIVGINGALCEFGSIVDAIAAAETGDTIYIPSGTYTELLGEIDKNLSLVASTADCLMASDSADSDSVTIDANGGSDDTTGGIVQIDDTATVTFTHITLRDATSTYGGIAYVSGNATLVLDDSDVRDGTASLYGGGVRALGTLHLINGSEIVGNNVTGNGNGGGVGITSGELILTDGNIELNNTAGDGGGIWLTGSSVANLHGSGPGEGVHRNTAGDDGGGIYVENSTLTIHDELRVNSNTATGDGGGLYVTGNSIATLTDGAILGQWSAWGNNATNGGGAYVTGADATLNLEQNAEVEQNRAEDGGGIYAINGATVNIADSVSIYDNLATIAGGGFYLDGVTFDLDAGTIHSNTSRLYGGGLFITNGGVVNMSGTAVVEGNNAPENFGSGGGFYVSGLNSLFSMTGGAEVRDNEAIFGGGGYVIGSAELRMLNGGTFLANQSTSGGGVYIGNAGIVLTVDSLGDAPLFVSNIATDGTGRGGALFAEDTVNVDLNGVRFVTNEANFGGAVYAHNARVDMVNNRVNENIANQGGGVHANDDAHVTISSFFGDFRSGVATFCDPTELPFGQWCSDFFGNTAGEGSAIYNDGSDVEVSHTAFTAHHGEQFNIGSTIRANSIGTTDLDNVLIAGGYNQAHTIYADTLGTPHTIDMRHVTLTDNAGWTIFADENINLTVRNSIVWGNTRGSHIHNSATFQSFCTNAQTEEVGTQPFDSAGDTNADPLFTVNARGAYFLGAGSPSIDRCFSGGSDYDLEWAARPQNGSGGTSNIEYDMGAFEYSGGVPTAVGLGSAEIQPAHPLPLISIFLLLLVIGTLIKLRNQNTQLFP